MGYSSLIAEFYLFIMGGRDHVNKKLMLYYCTTGLNAALHLLFITAWNGLVCKVPFQAIIVQIMRLDSDATKNNSIPVYKLQSTVRRTVRLLYEYCTGTRTVLVQ